MALAAVHSGVLANSVDYTTHHQLMGPSLTPVPHACNRFACAAAAEEADVDTSNDISLTALSRSWEQPRRLRIRAPVAVGEDITAGGRNCQTL